VLVVWDIRGADPTGGGFVPAISVTVAIALALVSLVLLIFFVHHISRSVKASQQIIMASRDLHSAAQRLYPGAAVRNECGTADPDAKEPVQGLASKHAGYLQTVDIPKLLSCARRCQWIIELRIKPGDHCTVQSLLARVFGTTQLSEKQRLELLKSFEIGGERTPEQDIRYHLQQLAQIVIRALSPGINDPFTALNGVDQLVSGIQELARKPRPCTRVFDDSGTLRLILPVPEIGEILETTIGHITIYASGDPFVLRKLRDALEAVAPDIKNPSEWQALARVRTAVEEKLRDFAHGLQVRASDALNEQS
jgi:uncharacterized membrane protein